MTALALIRAMRLFTVQVAKGFTASLSTTLPGSLRRTKCDVADERQAFTRDGTSDFLTLLSVWRWFQKEWDGKTSNRAFIDACREKFLVHVRLREWRELHRQLSDLSREASGEARVRSSHVA
jgi:hypothetical protein